MTNAGGIHLYEAPECQEDPARCLAAVERLVGETTQAASWPRPTPSASRRSEAALRIARDFLRAQLRLTRRRGESAIELVAVEPLDLEHLAPRAGAGDDRHPVARDAGELRDELDEGPVRAAALRRRRDPGAPAVAVPPDELGPAAPGETVIATLAMSGTPTQF